MPWPEVEKPAVAGRARRRRPGSKNKRTLAIEAAVRQTVEGAKTPDLMPVDFLLAVVRNEDLPLEVRIDAAKSCAGYFSPKLASVNATVQAKGQYWISDQLTPEEWIAEFCTERPEDAQIPLLDSVQRLEIEARDKKIAELEHAGRQVA
jgi:hypothetical protein